MKRAFTLAIVFFLLLSKTGYAQTISTRGDNNTTNRKGKSNIKWIRNPFDHQVFIENKGQFNGILPGKEKIYYAVDLGDIEAFFTGNGIVYQLEKYPKPDLSKGQDPDENGPPKPIIKYQYSEWKGANNSITTEGNEKQSFYYTYPSGMSGTIKTNVFKKITFHNLYPGIDVEYSFKNGKPGIEYRLIVHPGANISQAKLLYSKARSKANVNGAIEAQSNIGTFNMSAPKAFYTGDNNPLKVSYILSGNEESFSVANPDSTKTYAIDPWITNPYFSDSIYNKAYDLDYDNHGNVYVYGGGPNPYQLIKLNSAGIVQWAFNATLLTSSTDYYGDMAVDRVTAESYLVEGWNSSGSGARAEKVNSNGILMASFPGNTQLGEMYRIEYDACNRDIIVGGGGTSAPYQSCILDTAMISITPVNIEGVGTGFHDIALLTIDPDGNNCYMATTQSLLYIPVENNYLLKLPLPSLSPSAYNLADGLSFHEVGSIYYTSGTSNGFNGMAASPNWLYLYAGDTLMQMNKTTGLLNKERPLTKLFDYRWGGLDVDACDDIYVGFRDSIKIYNSALAPEDSLALPVGDTIFDLHLGQHNLIYACGLNFVASIDVPNPPNLISSASGTPSSCSDCNGTATVNINCGIAPYIFNWSNGNTNQTDTGLCPGSYTVTVTDAACPPITQTAIVNVPGENGFSAFITDSNPDCELRKGNATIHVTGGVPPYTYHWSNGSTNQTDTGLVAGTYICIVKDNSGCIYEIGVTLINPTAPTLYPVPSLDTICSGESVNLTVSGAKTYVWKPSLTLSCDSCANPTATPSVTTTYTITGMDSNGCTASVVATIKVYPSPKPVITGKDSVCSGYTDTLKVTGGTTYLWSTGATTTSINYHTIGTQTITVIAHNGICSKDTSFVIHVVSPSAAIKVSADSVCPGDSVLLTGSGGATYKWSNGKTTSSIWINPLTTKTYTLHAYAGTCNDSATKLIKVISYVTASISAQNDTICPLGTTTITVTAAGGEVTGYLWNTGATTSSITVTNTVTNSYTATVYGLCGSVQKTMQVLVVPLPKPAISGTEWKCRGIKDTLIVSSSTNPTTYLWSNGKTTSTIVTGGINADSIFSVTAFNSLGCPVTIIDTVLLRQPPSVVANPPAIFCAGQPITLTALANGTYPPFTYNWSTGQTGPSITIDPGPDTTTTYTVTASNGCSNIATTTAIPNVPILYACCNQILSIEHDSANRHDTAILVASGNSKKYQWLEQPDNGSITCLNPPLCDSVRVITTVSTAYTVVGTDSNGCQTEQLLFVTIDIPCFNLTIPNVFTPTNPGILGLDDVFYIKTQNVDGWDLTIYDRWGKEMYHSTNPYQYWNGNTEGGSKASAGVYYYIISGTCQNTTYKKDGFVQLIR